MDGVALASPRMVNSFARITLSRYMYSLSRYLHSPELLVTGLSAL
jgi:hypothetical protein